MFSHIKSGMFTACHTTYYGEFPTYRAFLQFVRWVRKPIWAPIAKSKMFRIPERKHIPEDENNEIKRLYNNYRTEIKSIRSYLMKEYEDSMKELPAQNVSLADEEIAHALKVNEIWNKEIKAIRDLRLAKEEEEERNKILQQMIQADQEAEDHLKFIEAVVKREKNKSIITPDKLDEAIEYALAHPVDYNYSIDLEGNYIYGLKGKPEVVHNAVDQKVPAAS